MNKRDLDQENAPALDNNEMFARGEQLSLLADSPEPMPVAPSPGTLAARHARRGSGAWTPLQQGSRLAALLSCGHGAAKAG